MHVPSAHIKSPVSQILVAVTLDQVTVSVTVIPKATALSVNTFALSGFLPEEVLSVASIPRSNPIWTKRVTWGKRFFFTYMREVTRQKSNGILCTKKERGAFSTSTESTNESKNFLSPTVHFLITCVSFQRFFLILICADIQFWF